MATVAPVTFRTAPGTFHGAWLRWTAIVGLGEAVAFAIPLTLGILGVREWDLEPWRLYGLMVGAGGVAGLVLGVAQVFGMRAFPARVKALFWIPATMVGVAGASAFGWLVPTYIERGEPAGIVAGITFLAVPAATIALTVPQSEVLAHAKVRAPYLWIVFSALAWGVGLAMVLIAGLIVGGDSSTLDLTVALSIGGVAMALFTAAALGWVLSWMTKPRT